MDLNGKGVIIVLVAVIIVSLVVVVRHVTSGRSGPGEDMVDWVCEECEHFFVAPFTMGNLDCPECRGEAVKTYLFYDKATGELVELFREKPADPEREDGEILLKTPGGVWMREDRRIIEEYGWPVRVERPDDLEYAPPGSEHRR